MKRIITFLRKTHYKMLCKIWWPFINNIKWHNIRATTKEVLSINKVKTLTDIKDLITKLYFLIDKSSKSDNQLFKGVCPPSYLYMKYVTETLSDEYNDFVTLIYHILSANEIECHQVAVCAPKICHRILIFKINDRWYANDYNLFMKDSKV